MTDPYYSRKSKDDSAMIACWCFAAVLLLVCSAGIVGLYRWVFA